MALGGGSGQAQGRQRQALCSHRLCPCRTQVLAAGGSQRRNRRPATGASSALLLQTSHLGPSGSDPWWLWGQGWPLPAHPPFSVLPPPLLWVPVPFLSHSGWKSFRGGTAVPTGLAALRTVSESHADRSLTTVEGSAPLPFPAQSWTCPSPHVSQTYAAQREP